MYMCVYVHGVCCACIACSVRLLTVVILIGHTEEHMEECVVIVIKCLVNGSE